MLAKRGADGILARNLSALRFFQQRQLPTIADRVAALRDSAIRAGLVEEGPHPPPLAEWEKRVAEVEAEVEGLDDHVGILQRRLEQAHGAHAVPERQHAPHQQERRDVDPGERDEAADPAVRDVAMIFLSGDNQLDTVRGAMRHHADGYLVKPFEVEDLKQQLDITVTILGARRKAAR